LPSFFSLVPCRSPFRSIYLALAICVGDFFCRRFYRFVSVAHRCAAASLVGLLISTWFTYLAGLAFAWTARPLLWANLLFFLAVRSEEHTSELQSRFELV